MRPLFDTSVLVPAVVDQLANHESAFGALRRYGGGEHRGCCSTHALAECYATLTALPLPSRVLPEQARILVEESIGKRLEIVQLTSEDYLHALRLVADLGLASGAIYDALHARCAVKASVDRILTYNVTDFERFQLPDIVVTAP